MFCKKCGTEMADSALVCPNCGTGTQPQQPIPAYAAAPLTTPSIPKENQPLSAWGYFGLQILFALPVIGFIFLIIFSINGSNINRRNFARSYWCSLVLLGIAVAICAAAGISIYQFI